MIIIINGPLGIGKTSLSWALLERFERAVMLDGDYLGAVRPFDLHSPARVEYLYQTLRQAVAFHQANGYPNFVINYVFETPESLARLRQLLANLDPDIRAFRLVCRDEAEMERRIRRRAGEEDGDPAHLAWELARFRQLAAIQDENARRGDLGQEIDAAGRSPEELAQIILPKFHTPCGR